MTSQNNPFGDLESTGQKMVGPIQLTAAQFLGLVSNVSGYLTPDEMMDYSKVIEPYYLELLLQCMHEKRRIIKRSRLMENRVIGPYYYYTFQKPKGTPGVTVPVNAGIQQFIADYEDGKIEITFDVSELARVTKENLSKD